MIQVSLTDFVDFVHSSGSPKLTKVKQIKNREEYHPAFDFWKPLREGIIDYHKSGKDDKSKLDKIVDNLKDDKKKKNYPSRIKGYKSFLGRKSIEYFEAPTDYWIPNNVRVSINPELGLKLNNSNHVIKLYFKADKLSKRKIDVILLLMHQTLHSNLPDGIKFSILDVGNGKLFSTPNPDYSLAPLLKGEIQNFQTIWSSL